MVCEKCGSQNVVVSNELEIKTKHRGCLGWMWWLFLAVCTFGMIIIIPLITNSKIKSKNRVVAICQNCGHKQYVKR